MTNYSYEDQIKDKFKELHPQLKSLLIQVQKLDNFTKHDKKYYRIYIEFDRQFFITIDEVAKILSEFFYNIKILNEFVNTIFDVNYYSSYCCFEFNGTLNA
jgi:hypothetical protein